MATRGNLDRDSGPSWIPHGQHLALLQFQGHQSAVSPVVADRGNYGCLDYHDLVLFPDRSVADGDGLRFERDRDSHPGDPAAASTLGAEERRTTCLKANRI